MIVLNLRGGTAIEVHPSPLMTPFLVRLLLLRQIACGGFVLPYSFVFQSIRQLKSETAGARGGARDGRPTSNVNSRIPALVMHMLCNSTGNPFDDETMHSNVPIAAWNGSTVGRTADVQASRPRMQLK